MAKIEEKLSGMIMSAMKDGEKTKVKAYKNIKAKFMEFKTAKNAKPLDEAVEITIMKKMVTELKNDADIFTKNGRNELAEDCISEADIISSFLPKEASIEEIKVVVEANVTEGMTMKDMGKIVKIVKESFSSVDGKVVADIVKSYLN